MQIYQKKSRYRKTVRTGDVFAIKVIHIKKAPKIDGKDLYTKLCTLSTAFLCKFRVFFMVTKGTDVLWKTNEFTKNGKKKGFLVDFFEIKKV